MFRLNRHAPPSNTRTGARARADTHIGVFPRSVGQLVCPWCAQRHRVVGLRHRQRALCVRCGTVLATRSSGRAAALAFGLAGLLLAPPAVLLPFVIVHKFGAQQVTWLFSGVGEMWNQGMHWLGLWVIVCGIVAPTLLLGTLLMLLARGPDSSWLAQRPFWRAVRALEKWAMPEVQVLAVLVAFTKLGSVVDVSLGGGFWCYAAMSLSFLFAWRSFELDPSGTPPALAARKEMRA